MNTEVVQKKLHKIQDLCEELTADLSEVKRLDFFKLIHGTKQAEEEWDDGNFDTALNLIKISLSLMEGEMKNLDNMDEISIILEWIRAMPTGTIENFGR